MRKILIIEDDELMINLYRRTFEKQDYEVRVASGGQEGLDIANEFQPDAILLDMMMPKMDGFEVLKKLRSDSNTSNTKVIVLSNLAGKEDAKKALDLGANRYLIKSEHEPSEVVKTVEEIIEAKESMSVVEKST